MRYYNDIHNLSDQQLKVYKKALRRKIVLRRRMMFTCFLFSLLLLVIFCITSSNVKAKNSEVKYKYYKQVELCKGDNLWSIGQEYYDEDYYKNVRDYINEVCKINHISNKNSVKYGTKIMIPYYSSEYIY